MRRGFSLIEMLVVLTLMSLVLATVAMRWNSPYRAVVFQSDLERVTDFDFKSRRHATSRNRNCRLLYDLDHELIEASRWNDSIEKIIGCKLSNGVILQKLRTSAGETTHGVVSLNVFSDGSTQTYAILIKQGKKQRWIIFAGRTGQAHVTSESSEIDGLFKKMQIQRADVN